MDPWTFNVIGRPMRNCQGLLASRREPLAKNLADLKKAGAAQQDPGACLAARTWLIPLRFDVDRSVT